MTTTTGNGEPPKRRRKTVLEHLDEVSASMRHNETPPAESAPIADLPPLVDPTLAPPMPSSVPFASAELPRVENMERPTVVSSGMLRSLEAQRDFETRMAHEDAVAELLADLDFEKMPYQIDLIRKEPEYHPDGTYIGLGWSHTYTEPVTLKAIADKFGGGKYQLVVRVPTAPGSNKYRFFDSKIINVTGEPIIPPSRGRKVTTDDSKATDAMREFMSKQLEIMETQTREAKKEAKEMVASMQQNNNPTFMLEMMREERKMQESRLAAEREEARIAREEERRRFEMQLEHTRLQHEKQLEMLRMEAKERADLAARQAEMARAEAARLAADQPKSMETMMMFMQRMDAEKQANAQKASEFMFQMMQQSAQNNVQQMQAAQNLQMNILSEALREAKSKKNDVLEMATQFKTLKSVFGGGDEGGGGIANVSSWQDIVREGMDKLPTIIQAVRPAIAAAPAAPSAQPSVGPGAQAVLENPPPAPPPRKPRRLTDGGQQAAGALPPGAAQPQQPAARVDNTIADYEFVGADADPEAAMTSLVKSLDLGLQRGLSSRSLYDQILLKFPVQIRAILKLASVSQINEVIGQKAPAHWAISSPRGRRAIEEMHTFLTSEPVVDTTPPTAG